MTTLKNLNDLAFSYDIPFEDVFFIDLNRKGVVTNFKHERIRFFFHPSNPKYFFESKKRNIETFFLAIPTYTEDSDYFIKNGNLLLGNELIGNVYGIQKDTCDSSYPRRNGTVFNLNVQSKSLCHGCKFCHTFIQTGKDISNLGEKELVKRQIQSWLNNYNKLDLSYLFSVAVVTGCFGSEEKILGHLKTIRKIFLDYKFYGEIFYLGSEIKSKKVMNELKKIRPFTYCLSLECFQRRYELLKFHKSKISLEHAKKILEMSKESGFGTTFSYILGIDNYEVLIKNMEEFLNYINRIPVINLFQPHTPQQTKLISSKAKKLTYYLEIRKILEKFYKDKGFKPKPWENYRGLWYLKYGDEEINDIRLP